MLGYSHVAPLEQLGSSIQQLALFATMGIKDPMVMIFLDCLIGHQHCPLLNSHGKLFASTMKCNVPAEHGGEFCKMASFSLDYSHFISKYWALLRASGSRGSLRLLDGNMVIYSHPKPR